jgi:hypothetical protein
VERRDHHEREADRDIGEPSRARGHVDPHLLRGRDDQHRDRGLAQRAEDQAGEGDPELAGGEVVIEVRVDVPNGLRAPATLIREPFDARSPDLDERKLGRDEEPVQDDEEERRPESPGAWSAAKTRLPIRGSGPSTDSHSGFVPLDRRGGDTPPGQPACVRPSRTI